MIQDKYWICDECAKDQNLIAWKTGNTKTLGRCAWCESDEEKTLTPVVDFRKEAKE